MSTIIMKSKPIIEQTKLQLSKNINTLKDIIGVTPKLTVIQANEDKASDIYIRNKRKFCEDVGMGFELQKVNISGDEEDVLRNIDNILYSDIYKDSDGIIIQKPIAKIDEDIQQSLFDEIFYRKDVDCLGKNNTFKIYCGNNNNLPCTVQGVIDLLDYYKIPIQGQHIVILGRSNIVGKPLLLSLINRDATVTLCHSKTENLETYTKTADILIVAIGKPKFIKEQHLSLRTKVVIDVGINRDENNKICGDCDYDNIVNYWNKCKLFEDRYITPVPGGVGPLTVCNLIKNTYKSFLENNHIPEEYNFNI